jgi:phage terminase large subunit-like protein
LRSWQSTLLDGLLARRRDGRYRHREALIGMPRKNGKSALGAGRGLYGLLFGPNGDEVYSCAAEER